MMRAEGIRQSDRITLRLPVDASWFGTDGTAVKQTAETLLVSRNGGVIRLTEKLFPGQEITLHRQLEGDQSKSARARIMAEIDREGDGFIYAIAILEPRVDFWDIEFPVRPQGRGGLGKNADGMQLLPEAGSGVPERDGVEVVRNKALHCQIVPAL